MQIRSILVNVDLDRVDTPALRFAIELARSFEAGLIGIGANEPHLSVGEYSQGFATQQVYEAERAGIASQLALAGDRFHALLPAGMEAQWHPAVTGTTRYLIEAAAEADLVITDPERGSSWVEIGGVDIGELVLRAGRPVIAVADRARGSEIEHIVVGWKDRREARRALVDAMPLLLRARTVLVLTIGEGDPPAEQQSLDAVLAWLLRHGVKAQGELIAPDRHQLLTEVAAARDPDLVVTGCYGHLRGLELLFGGVSRRLLEADQLTRLLSH